jgi:hypothetical protein
VTLGYVLWVSVGWAGDAVLQQAQQKLIDLGYDPGSTDGVHGPRTRQALEAFQRAQNLPVTGILDTPTLQALQQAATASPGAVTSPLHGKSPLQVVVAYLRFSAIQPAGALPYVTENFLDGLSPQEWVSEAQRAQQQGQGGTYIGWKVQRLSVADTQAIVYVQTRVLIQGQEYTRYEIFTLVRTPEDEWLIDGWRPAMLSIDRRTGS